MASAAPANRVAIRVLIDTRLIFVLRQVLLVASENIASPAPRQRVADTAKQGHVVDRIRHTHAEEICSGDARKWDDLHRIGGHRMVRNLLHSPVTPALRLAWGEAPQLPCRCPFAGSYLEHSREICSTRYASASHSCGCTFTAEYPRIENAACTIS